MDFKPTKIGKFLLLEKLATGGMAELYRAKASGAGGFEKQLAIKRILPNYATNDEFRKMFEYEARLSSMLTHANIVQIYDFVKTGDTYLLAMEYVDGKNLRQFINKVKKLNFNLPIQYGVYIMNEVCKGLEYAHKKKDDVSGRALNVVHRDMSPQNIMISYDGAVKIVDFGIAKAKDRVDETRSGVIKGKFGYMSPEQANGENIDHRTDIFSTAIILFELLTFRRLFAAENDMATLKLIQECVFPAPTRVNPKIPVELEKILLKGLTKDPKLRYQSAGDFQRSLQDFLSRNFPSFSQKDLGDAMQKIFQEEIATEKRRFEQIHRQSIPFSQGAAREPSEFDDVEEALEGDVTRSESAVNTSVTSAGDDEEEERPQLPNEFILEETSISAGASVRPARKTQAAPSEKTVIESITEDEAARSLPTEAEPQPQARPEYKPLDFPPEEPSLAEPGSASVERDAPTLQGAAAKEIGTGDPTLLNEEEPAMPRLQALDKAPPEESQDEVTNTEAGISKIELMSAGDIPAAKEYKTNSGSQASMPPLEPVREQGSSRRRERSISASADVRRPTQPSVSQNAPTQAASRVAPPAQSPRTTPREPVVKVNLDINPRVRSRPERPDYFEEREREPRSRLVMTAVLFVAVVGGVAYLYQFYRSGELPSVISKVREITETNRAKIPGLNEAPPTAPVKAATPTTAENANGELETETKDDLQLSERKVPAGECTFELNSDPPGATVLVDTQIVGKTPSSISLKCNTSVNYTLRLEGYEPYSENIYLKDARKDVIKVLKKIPMGSLKLILNQNADVFVEDAPARAVTRFIATIIPIRANRKVHVRFVNRVFQIDEVREFLVDEDKILTKKVELGDRSRLQK